MVMVAMRLEKLCQVDLNLLITFAAIAEEKRITAATSRLRLRQPAVSRALQRARAMFQDDLFVRSPRPAINQELMIWWALEFGKGLCSRVGSSVWACWRFARSADR